MWELGGQWWHLGGGGGRQGVIHTHQSDEIAAGCKTCLLRIRAGARKSKYAKLQAIYRFSVSTGESRSRRVSSSFSMLFCSDLLDCS